VSIVGITNGVQASLLGGFKECEVGVGQSCLSSLLTGERQGSSSVFQEVKSVERRPDSPIAPKTTPREWLDHCCPTGAAHDTTNPPEANFCVVVFPELARPLR